MDNFKVVKNEVTGQFYIENISGLPVSWEFDNIIYKCTENWNHDLYLGNLDGKVAIFRIGTITPISEWHDAISIAGYLEGSSKYFVGTDNKLDAIYTIQNEKEIRISPYFDFVEKLGLIEGKSDYFVVRNNQKKYLKAYENGKVINIIGGCKEIYPNGLILNQGNWFVIEDQNEQELVFEYNSKTNKIKKMKKWFSEILTTIDYYDI